MLLASAIPASAQIPDLAAFDAAVRASLTSEAVRRVETPSTVAALAMLMRVDDPGDPIFAAAAGAQDPVLAKIANLLQSRLENGRPCFATTGPGARAARGRGKLRAIQGGP